nr:hypothetical protein [Tanacetum cinerariifolium]
EEFEDFSDNSTNEVNATSTLIPAFSTNTFSAAGPSNTAVSPTLGESSYVDPSQYHDNPNMPALEDITYSDDEEDVGAEADFINLETTIIVSHIPTTIVHEDHHVSQIIGDLSSAPLTRSMTRMVTNQGFEDPDYPEKVYKVVKALYGLHQALGAWQKGDILLGQIYVDDIVFGFTNKDLCKAFEKLIKEKFQMSSMGELTFFLGLQVKQKLDGIFISQDKYVAEILRKFGLIDGKSVSTPIDTEKPLLKDSDGEDVDVHTYRLISWQCKKKTVVATSSTEAEYVAAASCCAQVLWIQNQLLDYGPDQTVSGKDSLNSLMADNLPKIVWYSTHHVALIKNWLVQKQMAIGQTTTGKENSNPFMAVKKVNDVVRLQAQINRKKVIIIEATVREALHLDDAKSIDRLPNEEIFTELARMGAGKDFSGVDSPLFDGMLVPQQAAADVNNVVADDVPAADAETTPPSPPPTTTPPPPQELPSTSKVIPTPPLSPIAEPSSPPQQQQPSQPTHDAEISLDLLHTLLETCTTLTRKVEALEKDKVAQALKVGTAQRVESSTNTIIDDASKQGGIITDIYADKDVTLEEVAAKDAEVEENVDVQGRPQESQAQIYKIDLEHADKVLSMQDDEPKPAELKEVVEVVTTATLMTKVVTTAAATITAAAPTITTDPSDARRRKEVVIRDPEETATPSTIIHFDLNPKTKEKGLWNMAGFKLDYFKGMSYDAIRLIFEKYFNSNVAFLEKSKEQLEEEESRALKRTSESLEEKAAKKEKLDEEVEEKKKHLQIVPKDDDDVYTEATPLALKVLVVDYKIYSENNKPYYKIKRADGSHQLFLSFLSLLRNFDREDLEVLWQLVKERFSSLTPKNFLDDFLLTTLTTMFEKLDVQAQIWNIGVDAAEEFKENMLRDYYYWLKTYCCQVKLMLLDDVADIKLRLQEQSAAVEEKMKENTKYLLLLDDGNDNSIKWYQEPKFGLEIWWCLSGSESRPPMLNKENYMPWSSRLLCYAKSRPNGKLIYNSIINGQYVRRMISEPDELKAERLARTQDPLALMTNSNNPYTFLAPHQDQQSFNQNYMQQPMPNHKDITDPTTAMNMALALMAKAFKLNYSTPTNNNQRISSNPRNRQIAQPRNLNGYNAVQNVRNQVAQNPRVQNVGNRIGLIGVPRNANLNGNGVGHFARNYMVRPRRRDAAYLQTQLLIAQKEEAGIQVQDEEFDLIAVAADLDEIEEVNANSILMANLQQASTLGTQSDKALVYDSNGSAEVHDYENCDDNVIFNMFTQEEQYTELLEPIPKQHQVP